MAYRRRYKKRTYKRKGAGRSYRRRYTRRTRINKRGQKLYLFKRFCDFGALTISNITGTGAAYNFSLSDLPNYTEFTALYDSYKINAVKITFRPQQTQSISIGAVNNPNASSRFMSAIDYNDGTAPTSMDEIRQYQSCKVTGILKPHSRYIFKPKILTTDSFSMSPWLSTSVPNTNYFGLKLWVEPMDSTSTTSMDYTVECKYYLSFKMVK